MWKSVRFLSVGSSGDGWLLKRLSVSIEVHVDSSKEGVVVEVSRVLVLVLILISLRSRSVDERRVSSRSVSVSLFLPISSLDGMQAQSLLLLLPFPRSRAVGSARGVDDLERELLRPSDDGLVDLLLFRRIRREGGEGFDGVGGLSLSS